MQLSNMSSFSLFPTQKKLFSTSRFSSPICKSQSYTPKIIKIINLTLTNTALKSYRQQSTGSNASENNLLATFQIPLCSGRVQQCPDRDQFLCLYNCQSQISWHSNRSQGPRDQKQVVDQMGLPKWVNLIQSLPSCLGLPRLRATKQASAKRSFQVDLEREAFAFHQWACQIRINKCPPSKGQPPYLSGLAETSKVQPQDLS